MCRRFLELREVHRERLAAVEGFEKAARAEDAEVRETRLGRVGADGRAGLTSTDRASDGSKTTLDQAGVGGCTLVSRTPRGENEPP